MPAPSAAKDSLKADPNVFAAAFLAGMEAGIPNLGSDGALSTLKGRWHVFREFIEWVADGKDVEDYAAMKRRAAELEARKAEVERLDREAQEARIARAQAAHGAV